MTALRELLRSRTLWVGLILIVGYWPVVRPIPTVPQTEFLRIARIVVAAAVSVAFLLGSVAALRRRRLDFEGQLIIGIVLTWIGTVGNGLWILIWASSGQPHWMLETNINGFWLFLQILGGVLHLTAHDSIHTKDGSIPKPAWIKAGLVVGACFAIGISFLAYAPDMSAIAEWLRPIFEDALARRD